MNAVYYTCLNQHCPKHRNIFLDGDLEHAECQRTVFQLEDHRKPPGWRRYVLPSLMALGALITLGVMRKRFS